MNDQVLSMLVGFGVVVGLRMLDWFFPRGYVWKQVEKWAVKSTNKEDDNG